MDIDEFVDKARQIEAEIAKVMVGQKQIIRHSLIALLAGGNVLLEGVPGLGKTMLVKTLSQVLSLEFKRIQFTPDLMPADIVGTSIISEDAEGRRAFQFQAGPVFANIVLADEINRATPKTQSALLEAMQERTVTAGGKTRNLPDPFFVLATQNPLEMEGTYPLPEAQTDRFLFKLLVEFPGEEELAAIISRDMGSDPGDLERIASGEEVLAMQDIAAGVPVAERVNQRIVKLILASHPDSSYAPEMIKKYVRYGASPRAGQALIASSRVRALIEGRYNVAFADIEELAYPVLRHRIILNFEGEAEGIKIDDLIGELLAAIEDER
ncbi:AAA family ATPase [Syntrophomonas wolfei]|uniref:Methanol dehydrogenase regulator n=1 Tax=Syntrophomonas wolfei subsp. wolfei (strain DSM 2245B / Goettingen) TaxID=335541 RepID=Q0AW87_SYNWW|nr:MoxR family ATPase [Syntrophomonas wolfei]ABI69017.1 methanol dehydrogenase regulator [Syntrophomonas wolfei subsp. wolfei str. Goettingen G311]